MDHHPSTEDRRARSLLTLATGLLLCWMLPASLAAQVTSFHGATTHLRSGHGLSPESSGGALQNGDFTSDLSGWTAMQSGGGAQPGQVAAVGGQAVFTEGTSFLVTLEQAFQIPPTAQSLRFEFYPAPGFDLGSTFIPDAFEASLLTPASDSLVPTWHPLATSFFNRQESGTVNLGPTATFDGTVVTVDVSTLPVGTPAVLYFDLVGADFDTGSGVTIDGVAVQVVCAVPTFWTAYGPGHPGTLGVPSLALSAPPILGTVPTLTVTNSKLSPTPACALIGLVQASLDLGIGGLFLVDPFDANTAFVDFAISGPDAQFPFSIPYDVPTCGITTYVQVVQHDPGATQSFSFTPGLEVVFGY